jgi:hypothetical protein
MSDSTDPALSSPPPLPADTVRQLAALTPYQRQRLAGAVAACSARLDGVYQIQIRAAPLEQWQAASQALRDSVTQLASLIGWVPPALRAALDLGLSPNVASPVSFLGEGGAAYWRGEVDFQAGKARKEIELLRDAVARRTPEREEVIRPTILSLGRRRYAVGNADPVMVTVREDFVLSAFLRRTPLSKDELGNLSTCGPEAAVTILRSLKGTARRPAKYGGLFAPCITMPGKPQAGGYHVRILRQAATSEFGNPAPRGAT